MAYSLCFSKCFQVIIFMGYYSFTSKMSEIWLGVRSGAKVEIRIRFEKIRQIIKKKRCTSFIRIIFQTVAHVTCTVHHWSTNWSPATAVASLPHSSRRKNWLGRLADIQSIQCRLCHMGRRTSRGVLLSRNTKSPFVDVHLCGGVRRLSGL